MRRALITASLVHLIASSPSANAQDRVLEAMAAARHDAAAVDAILPDGTRSPANRMMLTPLEAEPPPCGLVIEDVFVLDGDVACESRVVVGDGATLDLNGFTLEAELVTRTGATVRNGTLLRGNIFGGGESDALYENLRVIEGTGYWTVMPGRRSTFTGCFFSHNPVAIDLFFLWTSGGGVRVENSVFENNGIGVANSSESNNVISSNVFRNNGIGVYLQSEYSYGTSRNEIRDNDFAGNESGLRFRIGACDFSCLDENRIARNRFLANRGSGLVADGGSGSCEPGEPCDDIDAAIEENVFQGNGFEGTG